jgi:hypothetical protein
VLTVLSQMGRDRWAPLPVEWGPSQLCLRYVMSPSSLYRLIAAATAISARYTASQKARSSVNRHQLLQTRFAKHAAPVGVLALAR